MIFPSSPLHPRSSFGFTSPRKNGRERQAGDKNRDADELCRGESGVDMIGRIIAAKIFNDGTEDGVDDQVGRKNLAVEFFAAEQPRQENVENQVQRSVVNFRGMNRQRRAGRADKSGLKLLAPRSGAVRKRDGPRQMRRASVTAAVQQADGAAKDAAQRDARREDVGNFPD